MPKASSFAAALQQLAQTSDLQPYLTQDEERQIDMSLSEHLDAQYNVMLAQHTEPVSESAALSLRRSLLLRRVAHLVALLNEMPDREEDNLSMASTTIFEPAEEAPQFASRTSSIDMGWPKPSDTMQAAMGSAPVILGVVVSEQMHKREGTMAAGARWLGGPLLWQIAGEAEPVAFITHQRCIVLSCGDPGYAASAKKMRDGPDRGHVEALLPITDYKVLVGDIGESYDLVKPLYASRKEGTAYRIRTYCPPDHVTLDAMVGEPHPHGQCADLESLNKTLVQRGLDMLCSVTMRANLNVRYQGTEDEEYFIGMKIETMQVHAYIPCQTVPAYSLGYAHHKSSTLLM